jgi:hypothetical protein
MTALGDGIVFGLTGLAQKVATGIGSTVVDATRVDTGLARSNWVATLGAPNGGLRYPYSPGNKLGISETANANGAKAQHKQAIEQYDARRVSSIFITNRVPYIETLNNGKRNVSPSLMVEQGLSAARAIVENTKILDTR